jgi:hypothetical protein
MKDDKNKQLMRWIPVPPHVFPRPQSALDEEAEENRKKGMYLSQMPDHHREAYYGYKRREDTSSTDEPESI